MISSLAVTSPIGVTTTIPVGDPVNGLNCLGIDGLSPVKASYDSASLADVDGTRLGNGVIGVRNIVLTIGLSPSMTLSVEALRANLYAMFPTRQEVSLAFSTDSGIRSIKGIVEVVESSFFSEDIKATVSILCPKPYFYKGNFEETTVTLNNSQDSNLLVPFRTLITTGIHFKITSLINANFSMHVGMYSRISANVSGDIAGRFYMNNTSLPQNIVAGNTIDVYTEPGNKRALFTYGSFVVDVTAKLYEDDDYSRIPPDRWPQFKAGYSKYPYLYMYYETEDSDDQAKYQVTASWPTLYEGI